jgi:hypothetical protein
MYLFYIGVRLDFLILMLANPLLGPLKGGGGLKIPTFWGPNGICFLIAISGPKKVSMINIS